MLKVFLALIALAPLSAAANGSESESINKYVQNAEIVGKGTYSQLFWDIYTAELYAPDGKYTGNAPYALSITYLAEINGKDIAERSIDEMKETGVKDSAKLADWGKQMSAIFPNVDKGSNLTAVVTDDSETIFLSKGKVIGKVDDIDFAPAFFGIWLKPETNDKNLRTKLLGDSK